MKKRTVPKERNKKTSVKKPKLAGGRFKVGGGATFG